MDTAPDTLKISAQADQLFSANSYTEALDLYKQALVKEGESADLYYQIGLTLSRLGRDSEAARYFSKAAKLAPDLAKIYDEWGEVLYRQKKYEEAIRKYKKLIAEDPTHDFAYRSWANALREQGKYAESFNIYQKATELGSNTDKAFAYWDWAAALSLAGDNNAAVEKYEQAARLDSSQSKLFSDWGDALRALNQQTKALEKFQQASEITPVYEFLYWSWGDALRELEKYDEAIEKYQLGAQTAQRTSDYAGLFNNWGLAYAAKQQYDAAIEKYDEALQLQPAFVYSLRNKGDAFIAQGKSEEAFRMYQQAIDANPQYYYAYWVWGNALYGMGRYEEAVQKYQQAGDIEKNNAEIFDSWGASLRNQEKYEEAIEKFAQAVQIDPNYINAHWGWADCLRELKKYDEAIAKYKEALAIDPNQAGLLNNWGWTLHIQQRYGEAIEKYKEALKIDPGYDFAYHNWIDALRLMGFSSEVDFVYAEVAKSIPDDRRADLFMEWGDYLLGSRRYQTAREKFEEAARKSPLWLYELHYKIAAILERQGKYDDAKKYWKMAVDDYRSAEDELRNHSDTYKAADHFWYEGNILFYIFRRYAEALRAFDEGLKLNPLHPGIMASAYDLYMEQIESRKYESITPEKRRATGTSQEDEIFERWYGWDKLQQARLILEDRIEESRRQSIDDPTTLAEYGRILLASGEYKKAQEILEQAATADKSSPGVFIDLGAVSMRLENYKDAIAYFRAVLERSPGDFTAHSNLAEAYLRANMLEEAEIEFHEVIDAVPCHIDSLIGLGQVYFTMGSNSDDQRVPVDPEEMLQRAIDHYSEVLSLDNSDRASKTLKPYERSAVYYARGHARANLYEVQSQKAGLRLLDRIRNLKTLRRSREDFAMIPAVDRRYYRAQRAIKKINEKLSVFSQQSQGQHIGSLLILLASLLIFAVAQFAFFVGQPVRQPAAWSLGISALEALTTSQTPSEVLDTITKIEGMKFASKEELVAALRQNLSPELLGKYEGPLLDQVTEIKPGISFQPIDVGFYILMSFGSLLFMIAAMYLDQITHMKLGTVEIEKSVVEQISKSTSLDIAMDKIILPRWRAGDPDFLRGQRTAPPPAISGSYKET